MTEIAIKTREGGDSRISSASAAKFADQLRGELIGTDHEGYERARRVWNGNIDIEICNSCAGIARYVKRRQRGKAPRGALPR